MYFCDDRQFDDLLRGAALLATGGGCVYEKKKAFLQEIHRPVAITEISDLKMDGLLCTVYAVGSTSNQETTFADAIQTGIAHIEKFAKRRLDALFAGELGAEHLAIMAASLGNAGVLDADGAGGRAVPEIVQDQFSLFDRHTTPAFTVDCRGNVHLFKHLSAEALEQSVRVIACRTNGLVLVFDHIMNTDEAQQLACGTLKRSMTIGQILRQGSMYELAEAGLNVIDTAIIVSVQCDPGTDFLRATVTLQGHDPYTLLIQNENLVLLKNREPFVTCPHLIMLIGQDNLPVHNSQLTNIVGQKVTIVTSKAMPAWNSSRGRELFSPRRFGWPYEAVYLV